MEYYELNALLNVSELEQIGTFVQIKSWTDKLKVLCYLC